MSVTAVPLQPLRKGIMVKVWLGVLVVILLGVGLAWLGTAKQQVTTTASGLRYRVLQEGTGPTATAADLIGIEYEGTLPDGTVFDRSPPGQPAPFTTEGTIPGFSEALKLMRKGGIYQLWIPPQLAYGASPPQGLPANATLEFRVRVVGILEGMAGYQQMMQSQQQGGGPGGPGGPGAGGPGGPIGAPGGPAGAPGGPAAGGAMGPEAGPGAMPMPVPEAGPGAAPQPAAPQPRSRG